MEYIGEGLMQKASAHSIWKKCTREHFSAEWQKGEKMADLINRQEAIDILELGAEILRRVLDDMDVVGIDREKYSYGLKLLESDIEDIKELPPAQLERKTGHWIEHENADIVEGYYVSMYECSCCHTWENDDSEYCPDCGADMRGEENEIN